VLILEQNGTWRCGSPPGLRFQTGSIVLADRAAALLESEDLSERTWGAEPRGRLSRLRVTPHPSIIDQISASTMFTFD
jgi:hypothetical protein